MGKKDKKAVNLDKFSNYTAIERLGMSTEAINTAIQLLNTALYFNTNQPGKQSVKMVENSAKLVNRLIKAFHKKCCKTGF